MNIVIITDKFYPKPLANAICACHIANCFKQAGNTVDIIAYSDSGISLPKKYNGMYIYPVSPDFRLQLLYYSINFQGTIKSYFARMIGVLLNRSKRFIFLPWFPLYSLSFPYRIFRKIEELHNKNQYDLLITVYAQFENALAGMWFKQKYPKCKWCLYTLDSFINRKHMWLPRSMRDSSFWLKRFLEVSDLFLYMKSREYEYKSKKFSKWSNKIKSTDIPLLSGNFRINSQNNRKSTVERWVYAGALERPHYSLIDAIKCFLGLPDKTNKVFEIYSGERFDCLELEVQQLIMENCNYINYCGYIAHDDLEKIYSDADVLVSMKYSNQISAKIFEYMNYGKIIVHFSGCKNDPNSEYILKYPKGIVIYVYIWSIDQCIQELNYSLQKVQTVSIESYNLQDFIMNKPEYTCNLIIENLK